MTVLQRTKDILHDDDSSIRNLERTFLTGVEMRRTNKVKFTLRHDDDFQQHAEKEETHCDDAVGVLQSLSRVAEVLCCHARPTFADSEDAGSTPQSRCIEFLYDEPARNCVDILFQRHRSDWDLRFPKT